MKLPQAPGWKALLEQFGVERMVWGDDWPVVNLGSGLPGWAACSRELLSQLTSEEQANIFQANARRVYRL